MYKESALSLFMALFILALVRSTYTLLLATQDHSRLLDDVSPIFV